MEQQVIQFISNHTLLCLAFIGIMILIAINEYVTQQLSPKSLNSAAAVTSINQDQAVVIDIRPEEAFRAGHIISAIHIPADNLKRIEPYKNKPLIIVCANGLQSNKLATKLRKQGFTQPMILNGGMSAWQAANLPVVKGKK